MNRFAHRCPTRVIPSLTGVPLAIILMFLGCGEPVPTGEILTVQQIEQIVKSTGADTVCLEDTTDSTCLTVVPPPTDPEPEAPSPVLHIHAENLTYVFFYEEKPILLAEAVLDTRETLKNLLQTGEVINTDIDIAIKYWRFHVYYPDTRAGTNYRLRKNKVRAVEGIEVPEDTADDVKIATWTRHDKADAETENFPDIDFTLETDALELTIVLELLIPDNTATFYINAVHVPTDPEAVSFNLKPFRN